MKPAKYLSIGKAAKVVGVESHTIRFWQTQFPHIKPIYGKGNHKYYDEKAISELLTIKHLMHDKGITIKGIQKMLIEKKSLNHDKEVGNVDIEGSKAILRKVLERLKLLRERL